MLEGLRPGWSSGLVLGWWTNLFMHGGRFLIALAVVLVGGKLILRLGQSFIERTLRQMPEKKGVPADNRRLQTMQSLLNSILRYTVFFIGALVVLDAAGVPITSLIAGAGIVGLAVGFGAQNLVRDVMTGFFILLEDQYGIGDYVNVAGEDGIVESVGLRTTRLRDFSGDLHTIPNGEIGRVTNRSRGPRRALIQVAVSYEADLLAAEKALQQMAAEAKIELAEIIDGPSLLGITDLGNARVTFSIWARTEPMAEWKIERELRRRAKLALDQAGILPPYPRAVQTVTMEPN
ncbi:MAG: mechanosensitive ion channel family protein [Firmicutes bacterium]|nr:mechanosensitive ion channel family protein [Bacillota bacterium]